MSEPILANKTTVKKIFDDAAARYDRVGTRVFEIAGARLVELMDIPVGARMLDIATGIGAVLIPAAERVGEKGRVIGIDLADGMLEQARREISARGISNAILREMDAEHLEFSDATFDAVACGFALFLMPAMESAAREMQRVCKASGRVGLTVWGKDPFDPAWKIISEQARAYGAEVRMPHKVAYAPEEIRLLLADAGWRAIETRVEVMDAAYANEDEWWEFQATTGFRAALERMTDATREKFKHEYLAKLESLKRADGSLHFPAPVLYAVAQKE
ncbi:MAG: methyltransferase domain-containing protein [Chloroflexi bacterium]|nr:methyltransferase domain-containing protein [Chloroflexota bacterium]